MPFQIRPMGSGIRESRLLRAGVSGEAARGCCVGDDGVCGTVLVIAGLTESTDEDTEGRHSS